MWGGEAAPWTRVDVLLLFLVLLDSGRITLIGDCIYKRVSGKQKLMLGLEEAAGVELIRVHAQ